MVEIARKIAIPRATSAAASPPEGFELEKDADHHQQRECLFDRLKAPQDLAEHIRPRLGGDLTEDHRGCDHDEKRFADPEREREKEDRSRDGKHAATLPRALRARFRASKIFWMFFLAFAAAGALRLYRLGHRSFWLDEILDVFTLRYSWGGMWTALQRGVYNPPLDYLIRKLVELLHPTDALRRLPGVIWGTACVVVFGALVARRSCRRIGAAASIFLAFAPYHVRYSQEVRPYALALLFVCSSLLCLDRCLERRSLAALAGFLLFAIAAGYTLYLAALMLWISAAAMLIEDLRSASAERSANARRLLRSAPILAGISVLAYLPWLGVLVTAVRSPAFTAPPPFGWQRVSRVVSYFGFAGTDWHRLGVSGAFFLALLLAGALLAILRYRLTFLAVWSFGGLLVTEVLEREHSVYDSVFHYLPAGIALTGLAAVPVGWLLSKPRARPFAWLLAAAVVALDAGGLARYYDRGRPDWRPAAAFLRSTPLREPILVETQYVQLCLAYYVCGPDWLCCRNPADRVIALADPRSATAPPGATGAWLVLPGSERVEKFLGGAAAAAVFRFPDAEGESGVQIVRLDAARRAEPSTPSHD